MPDKSDLHEFDLYADGEKNWSHKNDFEKLDKRLELRGTIAERPAAADVPAGAKYVVDEGDQEGAVFIEKSGSWDKQPVDAPAVSTEKARIDSFEMGYRATIGRYGFVGESDKLVVINKKGKIELGGPDEIGVTDAEDFGETLQETQQTLGYDAIRLAPRPGPYIIKTTANLDRTPHIFAGGKNKALIKYDETEFTGSVGINIDGSGNIWRMDSFKFDGRDSNGDPLVDEHVRVDGVNEMQLTHMEFRSANNWGINHTGNNVNSSWNGVFDCWFLDGAGFTFNGFQDLRLVGNRIHAASELNNVSDITRAANDVQSDVTVNGVTTAPTFISKEPTDPAPYRKGDLGTGNPPYTQQSDVVSEVAGDNSATNIIDLGDHWSGMFVVIGQKHESTDAFVDLVLVANRIEINAVSSSERGTLGTRTYDWNGTDETLTLAIDEAGEAYGITTTAFAAKPKNAPL